MLLTVVIINSFALQFAYHLDLGYLVLDFAQLMDSSSFLAFLCQAVTGV